MSNAEKILMIAKEIQKNSVVVILENGVKHSTHYYRKNGHIWQKTICGCICDDCMVYNVNKKPYVRLMSRKWYLDDEQTEIVRRIAATPVSTDFFKAN